MSLRFPRIIGLKSTLSRVFIQFSTRQAEAKHSAKLNWPFVSCGSLRRREVTELETLKATIVEAEAGIEQLKRVQATLKGTERQELHRSIQLMEEHLKDAQSALSKMEKQVTAAEVAKVAADALLRSPHLRSQEPPHR